MVTIALGTLSLFQALLIPGFLMSLRVKKIDIKDRLILSIPLSILANYVLILFLIIINAYTKKNLILIIAIEIILILFFKKDIFIKKENPTNIIKINKNYLKLTLTILVIYTFINETIQFYSSIGSVFTDWDAIVSYNRWAIDWAHQKFPDKTIAYPYGTYTYPQAIPLIYSICYVLTETTILEQFPKLIISIIQLASFAIFIRIFYYLKKDTIALLFSIIIYFLIFEFNFYKSYGHTGYIEPVIMFYSLYAIYSYILLNDLKNLSKDYVTLLTYSCLAVSGIALVKQHGILIAYGFPILVFLNFTRNIRYLFRIFLIIIFIISVIITPWYLFKLMNFINGSDSLMLSFYTDFNNVYTIRFYMRPIEGLMILFSNNYLYILIFPLLFIFNNKLAKILFFYFLLPYYFIWSLFLIYNIQNISIILPVLAILIGFGLQELSRNKYGIFYIYLVIFLIIYYIDNYNLLFISLLFFIFIKKSFDFENNIFNKYLYNPIIYILFIFTLVVGNLTLKYDNLIESALRQNLQIVNSNLNKKLKDFIDNNSGGIATSYQPMGFIHSLSERFFLVQCASKNQFLSGFALSEAKYYLVGDWCSEAVSKFMDKTTSLGKFNSLFRIDGFTLYELVDANLKTLLSKNGVIGLNSSLQESLNFPDSPPFYIDKTYNVGAINNIEWGRNSLSFSGKLPSTINNQKTEWIIVTIGGKALILSEITDGDDVSLKSEIKISKSLNFIIEVPYSILKKNTGTIRLFGVVNNKLHELFYYGPDISSSNLNSEINIDVKDKRIFLKNNKLDVRQLDL